MTDLHVTNGDGAANLLKASAVAGDVLPWRDPMLHGPFPAGLGLDDLSVLRAEHLAPADTSDAIRDFRLRDAHLRAAGKYDRVVLWFEHDLLDQLQLLQLLDWFAHTELGDTKLELICINDFSGIEPFRGLGQLDAKQIASLYDQRSPVTGKQLDVARAGWSAFRAPDPKHLLIFLEGDLTPLPFLRAALMRHLEEFPSSQTGLQRTEWQILNLVHDGISAPGRIFSANMDLETALYIGDSGTFDHIATLCNGDDRPLLSCTLRGPFRYPPHDRLPPDEFRAQRLQLTNWGRQVLEGTIEAFSLIKRDQWLGGVHLRSDQPMWTWDSSHRTLTLREP